MNTSHYITLHHITPHYTLGPRLHSDLCKRLLPPLGPWPLLFLLFRSLPIVAPTPGLINALMATAISVGRVEIDRKYEPHGLTLPQVALLDVVSTFVPNHVWPRVEKISINRAELNVVDTSVVVDPDIKHVELNVVEEVVEEAISAQRQQVRQ